MPTRRPASALHVTKRNVVRDEIAAVAMRLFAAHGFAATTIQAIAEAAGVSRRTFFRYFAAKEDVVVARIDRFGQEVGEALASRPATEAPLVALRHALDPLVAFCTADPAHATTVSRLICETPALRACHLDKQQRWQAHVAPEIARRLGKGAAVALQSRVLAAAALAAFDVAFHEWAEHDDQDLDALVDLAFAALSPMPASVKPRVARRPRA